MSFFPKEMTLGKTIKLMWTMPAFHLEKGLSQKMDSLKDQSGIPDMSEQTGLKKVGL